MRKLRLAAAVSLALASSGAFGLGLGDIEMRSALNQPMNAEIRLTSVKPGELEGMIVKLASADAFARAGIERSQVLQDLRFTVDESGAFPVIRISSSGPVVEPFLNFLLEVDWPQGRMVREYTVLLDPPVFLSPSSSSGSSSIGDAPALTNRNDNALVAPAPIERAPAPGSNAAVTESFSVEVIGDEAEVANEAASVQDLAEGEVVTLADESLLPSEDDGEVVVLSDLGAPNTAVEDAAPQNLAEFEFEVEVVGDAVEVGDDVPGSDDLRSVASLDSVDTTAVDTTADASDDGVLSADDFEVEVIRDGNVSSAGSSSVGTERTVQRGETLYQIAQSLAPSGTSVQQMMMALLRANESAFIDGNINLVRAGSILRVPDAGATTSLSQAEAVAAVAEQNQLWQEYRDNLRTQAGTQVASRSNDDASASAASSEPTAASSLSDVPVASTESAEETDTDVLSAGAREILEQARQEILQRDELRIVAEEASSDTVAEAGVARDGNAIAGIDQRVQLTSEQLSSTRLEAEDLRAQANDLQNTSDNLDALVALRQNEIAALEQRLAEARETNAQANAERAIDRVTDTASGVADGLEAGVADSANAASTAASDAQTAVATAAGNAAESAGNAAGSAVDAASAVVTDVTGDAGAAATDAVDTATGAVVDGADQAATAASELQSASATPAAPVTPPAAPQPWYSTLLADPQKLGIAGVGALGIMGVLGTLLWRRRRGGAAAAAVDEMDDELLAEQVVDVDSPIAEAPRPSDVDVEPVAMASADDSADATAAFEDTVEASAVLDDEMDNDDTISEIDVYLAYGLHGQAEDLLTDVIAKEPNNPVYARKLLETYHAQGNADAFAEAASDYHSKFGGDAAPEWAAVSAMGHELRPDHGLFAAATDPVASMGSSDGQAVLSGDEFADLGDIDSAAESVSRDFAEGESAADLGSDAVADFFDQSADPALAFDEADLEATGDFTEVSAETAAEIDDGVIEFPSLDDELTTAKDLPDVASSAAAAMDGIEAPDLDDLDLSASATAANEKLTDGAAELADDLTLDLDQLSGELSLDSTEVGSVDALEIPDLTADNELLSDSEANTSSGDVDEMDTMMDLAKAYIDMGDNDSASNALGEIVKGGNPDQVTEAETLLRKIS